MSFNCELILVACIATLVTGENPSTVKTSLRCSNMADKKTRIYYFINLLCHFYFYFDKKDKKKIFYLWYTIYRVFLKVGSVVINLNFKIKKSVFMHGKDNLLSTVKTLPFDTSATRKDIRKVRNKG